MSLGIFEVLKKTGGIDQELLEKTFARNYGEDPNRGYGETAHRILQAIRTGLPWRVVSPQVFGGAGSMGNGAAMRVAPLGAYFYDDLELLKKAAVKSAEITHWHPEGKVGAVAVALAAAWACRHRRDPALAQGGPEMLRFVIEHTPDGQTRGGIVKALDLAAFSSVGLASFSLGSGLKVTAPDTVPFALWCAARKLANFEEAMWTTVAGLGDIDTNCAIVGSIIALAAGEESIPPEWVKAREPLPAWTSTYL